MDKDFTTDRLMDSRASDMYFAITRTLREPAVWTGFINSISYYNRELGLVYTPSTVMPVEEFFGKPKPSSAPSKAYLGSSLKLQPAALDRLMRPGNHVRSMRVSNVDGEDGVLFAMPLELKADAPPASYLL
ncbi:hypothetical protein [Paenibacillus macerans]|uniref:hypothetical protein n=1 Tax=Paenibacillus macerans TaxID=44252 RepID=UPI003D312550